MRSVRGQLAYREALTAPIFGVAATVAGIFALAFAMIGPYGSHHVLSVPHRLLYCSFAHALHLVVAYAGFVGTLYLTRFRTELQTVAAFALEILVISAPCAAITYAVYSWYLYQHLSQPAGDIRVIQEMYIATVPSLIFANALVYSVVRLRVGAATAVATDEEMRPTDAPADEAPVARGAVIVRPGGHSPLTPASEIARPPLAPDAFHRRLPAEAGRDVVYLKAAGHYVNVTTTAGTAIILLRFQDACAELGDLGMRVHRSYWVAHAHVAAIVSPDEIRLTTGDMVPVSRPFRRHLRQRHPTRDA